MTVPPGSSIQRVLFWSGAISRPAFRVARIQHANSSTHYLAAHPRLLCHKPKHRMGEHFVCYLDQLFAQVLAFEHSDESPGRILDALLNVLVVSYLPFP